MAEIIKTWPAIFSRPKVREIFTHTDWGTFWFSLGHGRPKEPVSRIWFTHRGVILGSFRIDGIVRNDGSLPKLRSLQDGGTSEWQFKPDVWVAMCPPPCEFVQSRVYYPGFRGWRYFNFLEHTLSLDAKVRL